MSLVTPNVDTSISLYNSTAIVTDRYKQDSSLQNRIKELTSSTEGIQVTSSTSNGNTNVELSSESIADLWGLIQKNAKAYNEDPLFIAAIVSQESDFGKDAGMSGGGALGVIQIKMNDGPIQQLKQVGLWESTMTTDMKDPDMNLHVACCYLKYGYDKFVVPAGYGDDYGAWAAGYNGWWPSTLKYKPPCYPKNVSSENWNYYHQVADRYEQYKSGAKKVGEK